MLIGRSDDPQNPCRVAASKVSFPFGSGSRNPSGPAARAATHRPDTRPQPHRSRILLSHPLHPGGRLHTHRSRILLSHPLHPGGRPHTPLAPRGPSTHTPCTQGAVHTRPTLS